MEREIHSLILEGKYKGNVITRNLPQHIDNGLYTLIHFIGGMNFKDVIEFADNATEYEIEKLSYLLNKFPNTIQDIMPLAGNFRVLLNSPEYQEIVNLVKRMDTELQLDENLNDLVYREKPTKKHLQKLDNTLGNFKEFDLDKFKNINPPKNDSKKTENEIKEIEKIKINKTFIDTTDDIHEHFKKFLKTKDLEYPTKEIKKAMNGLSRIILELKYHYNRPRPAQVAEKKNLKLNSTALHSAKTPSYPSGHALRGRFIGRYLADKYPEHKNKLMKLGDEIGDGRLMAKVHYPSDNFFGKDLADSLYKHLTKKQTLTENIEIDSDGYYTTDTNPYVLEYITPKTKKALFKHWDSLGNMEWSSLKLFGIEGEDEAFDNVADVLYPLLAIEWLGGVENTPLAKKDWMDIRRGRQTRIRYKIIPLRFDYLFDESERFGEQGYSCYDIKVVIDWGTPGPEELQMLDELVPKDKRNKLMSYRYYDENTLELIEQLWETTETIRGDIGVMQFCRVEIEVVNP